MLTIEIRDFQNVKNLKMEVAGFCALVGQSNIGKSSVVRAISCVAENPPANSFIRQGAREAIVRITFHKTRKRVEWRRHIEDGASYILSDLDENGNAIKTEKLTRFGRSVPEPVQKLKFLRLFTENWTAPIAFAPQHHYFFLLNDPKLLIDLAGELQDLAALNRALQLAQKERRQAQDDIRYQDRQISKLQTESQIYAGTEQLVSKSTALQSQVAAVISLQVQLTALTDAASRFTAVNSECSKVATILTNLSSIDLDLSPMVVMSAGMIRESVQLLVRAKSRLDRTAAVIAAVDQFLHNIPDLHIDDSDVRKLSDLIRLKTRFDDLVSKYARIKPLLAFDIPSVPSVPDLSVPARALKELHDVHGRYSRLQRDLAVLDDQLKAADSAIDSVDQELTQLKAENPTCPICGTEWDNHE